MKRLGRRREEGRGGPVVNLTAAATEYPWPRFLLYDVLGDLTWAVVGLVAAAVPGVLLFKKLREPDAE